MSPKSLKGKEEIYINRHRFSMAMVVLFLIAAANAFVQEQASAPVFQEGDFWQFKSTETSLGGFSRSNPINGVYGLLYSQGKVRVAKLTDGQKQSPEGSAVGPLLALLGQGTIMYQDLNFPLFVGKKWSYKYEMAAIADRTTLNHTAEISVTGIEQVSTLAGNFSAFRLEKNDAASTGHYPWVSTYYYSPATKSVVKSSFDSATSGAGIKIEIELIKFGSAR